VHILPTERAVEKANRLLPQHEARFAELFDVFNTDELRTYISLLSKLANRIKSELHAQEQTDEKDSR
ncbi:MAG: hypothetical protein RLZ28_789, partial [Actinomycetota bacterium]